jgi:hypothetical protein
VFHRRFFSRTTLHPVNVEQTFHGNDSNKRQRLYNGINRDGNQFTKKMYCMFLFVSSVNTILAQIQYDLLQGYQQLQNMLPRNAMLLTFCIRFQGVSRTGYDL